MSSFEELKEQILYEARVTIASKDPEVVRNKLIVEIPVDQLMEIIEAHTTPTKNKVGK